MKNIRLHHAYVHSVYGIVTPYALYSVGGKPIPDTYWATGDLGQALVVYATDLSPYFAEVENV